MANDLFQIDTLALQMELKEIERKLSMIDNDLKTSIMDDVLKEAAEQLQEEQKRLLSAAPSEGVRSLASDLSVWKDNRFSNKEKTKWKAGYSDDKTEKSKKYFIIEFGRPGKKGNRYDKKGRRIGRVEPYSHIRAAKFLKRDSINRYIAERIDAEILERWNR